MKRQKESRRVNRRSGYTGDDTYGRPPKEVIRKDQPLNPIATSSRPTVKFYLSIVLLAAVAAGCIVFPSQYLAGWRGDTSPNVVRLPTDSSPVRPFIAFEKRFILPSSGCQDCGGPGADTDIDPQFVRELFLKRPWLLSLRPTARQLGVVEELNSR